MQQVVISNAWSLVYLLEVSSGTVGLRSVLHGLPVVRVALPQRVPYDFHGEWMSEE